MKTKVMTDTDGIRHLPCQWTTGYAYAECERNAPGMHTLVRFDVLRPKAGAPTCLWCVAGIERWR